MLEVLSEIALYVIKDERFVTLLWGGELLERSNLGLIYYSLLNYFPLEQKLLRKFIQRLHLKNHEMVNNSVKMLSFINYYTVKA